MYVAQHEAEAWCGLPHHGLEALHLFAPSVKKMVRLVFAEIYFSGGVSFDAGVFFLQAYFTFFAVSGFFGVSFFFRRTK